MRSMLAHESAMAWSAAQQTRMISFVEWMSALMPLGMLWGFIPCGLTYSILATALVTGSGARGAGLMLAFGLGTLPNLLLVGMLFKRFRDFTRNRKVRIASGVLVLGFGLFGLYHAPTLGGDLWSGVVCVT